MNGLERIRTMNGMKENVSKQYDDWLGVLLRDALPRITKAKPYKSKVDNGQ